MAAPARPVSTPPLAGQQHQQPHLSRMSSISASPPPAHVVALANGPSLMHQAMTLYLTNHFVALRAFFAAHGERDPKVQLVACYLALTEALSTHGESDLAAALSLIWALEKRASGMKAIEGRLLQADTHFLGAVIQLISQKHLKAALNLRKSWNFYEAASKLLQTYSGPDAADLRGWSSFGNGMFQLVMSLLPPTVIKLASYAGYGGDRDLGLRLLRESQESSSFMNAFSALIIVTYLVNIGSLTGEEDLSTVPQCEEILRWADERYRGGVLFLIMRSRLARCQRDLQGAMVLAKQAVNACRELPNVAVLIHFHSAWCSFFLQDWATSAHYFDCMVHSAPCGDYVPPAGQPKISAEEQKLIDEEDAQGGTLRLQHSKASAMTFYCVLCGICYMLLGDSHKARFFLGRVQSLLDPHSKKPIDLYAKRKSADLLSRRFGDPPEDALLDACELILTWNGASQMPAESCRRMIASLDDAESKRLPHWKAEQYACVSLYRADMLKGLGEIDAALQQMDTFMSYLPALQVSAKAKADGTLAFGFYTHAFLLNAAGRTEKALEQLQQAQKITGYDQYNVIQIRMHALSQQIKRTKAGGGASASAAASSSR